MENEIIKELESKFLSQSKFSNDIEELVRESGLTYIESIVTYCDENTIDIETVSKLISKPLKERIRCEAMQLNYLKKSSRAKLPL
ncbi:late promoter transcription accessory protein [Synechococcus phage DSL-LC02]|nr:late promoter transcription accessory protein [Synechococcus phage DSL-LC02]